MKASAVIVAGGRGKRLGRATPKAFVRLLGRPLVEYSLEAFQRAPSVGEIILVYPDGYRISSGPWFAKYSKLCTAVPGGRERTDSVRAGLRSVSSNARAVLIHDAARPLVSTADIEAVVGAALRHGAAILAAPVTDTIKEVRGMTIRRTVDRAALWRAQTPQGFRRDIIMAIHAPEKRRRSTDDSGLAEAQGQRVRIVPGTSENLKVTTATDLEIAACLLKKRRRG